MEEVLAGRTVEHWLVQLRQAGVPSGAVGGINDGIALAEELGLEPVVRVGGGGYLPQIRHPVTYSSSDVGTKVPPPGLGAHSEAVRGWLRGPADLPHLRLQLAAGPDAPEERKVRNDDGNRTGVPHGRIS